MNTTAPLIGSRDRLVAHKAGSKRTRTESWTACGKRIVVARLTLVNASTLRESDSQYQYTRCGAAQCAQS